jgi:predicted nuclease of predicted toxin-antitoxin system
VKLLFDQNLSPRLPDRLQDIFPDSLHVRDVSLSEAEDDEVWRFAKLNGFAIVSKNTDFQQRSFLYGAPPKVIWLRVGNCTVQAVEYLLRRHSVALHEFARDEVESYLVLTKP